MTSKQRSALKAMANTLRPAVIIGKGELTPSVLNEIAVALYHNELVKVGSLKSCEVSAKTLCAEVCAELGAEPVLCVGNRFVIYKWSDKKDIDHIVF
ncbi:MAG: YhbY family RNA-binding protein [Clostridia bacterium]|nr:YhbY family RNA-binding protein [Clostridia bacterium]MBQ3041658.1 YhbY family RNA-binding protein [Clostridia bacterium]MBQ9706280.1 YhbY family RNA-binding protein [Clostridia bacterium]